MRTTDRDGRAAFHWAMRTPNTLCLKWLCKYGSVPEAINQLVSFIADASKLSLLHHWCWWPELMNCVVSLCPG